MGSESEDVSMTEAFAALQGEIEQLRDEVSTLRGDFARGRGQVSRESGQPHYLRGEPKQLVTIRLEKALLERIDRFGTEEMPGRGRSSRSDVIRLLIHMGLSHDR